MDCLVLIYPFCQGCFEKVQQWLLSQNIFFMILGAVVVLVQVGTGRKGKKNVNYIRQSDIFKFSPRFSAAGCQPPTQPLPMHQHGQVPPVPDLCVVLSHIIIL